ncbi:MAG: chromosome partitioning protein ParB [Bradyrhizobium sp.]|nr:chromosome partitioning protein ParB [Bradyrhizobium sp.]
MTDTVEPVAVSGSEIFVPLNKLKKSPRNVRKVPHSEAAIEAFAASIHTKGMLQNMVVEPELNEGAPTGFYLVTAGEGRRLGQLLRAKRRQIKKSEPIRCRLDTENDPVEISLDENVTRQDMHPADELDAWHDLSDRKGWGAEEIGARFGVTANVVRKRLRLGAVSPKLIQVYREDGLTMDQLIAFAITDDHARQEQVFESLHHNREPWIIRRDLTANNVPAHDRRAVFVGAQAYTEAGGVVIRDLFTEDGGGFFEDAGLLDMLVLEKLLEVAAEVKAEGWKWTSVQIDFPHAHGLRRFYPASVDLPEDVEARYGEASDDLEALTQGYDSLDEMPKDVAAKVTALEAEIDSIDARRSAYDPLVIANGGVFVVLNHDGRPRIDRGFVRAEDEALAEPVADTEDSGEGEAVNGDEIVAEDGEQDGADTVEDEEEEPGKPISDALVRDLTAHRTLALRVALGEQPGMALVATVHTLAAQLFYSYAEAGCLEIRPTMTPLGGHADGIEDTALAARMAERHEAWAERMPRDVADLWAFVVALDEERLLSLLAHCASRTVNALRLPWDRKPRSLQTADRLATAIGLDVAKDWTPTVDSYLGRVTKAHIVAAVADGVSQEAATRIADMKKPDMAQAAEQLLAGSGWLPAVMRTPKPEAVEAEAVAPDAEQADGTEPQAGPDTIEQPIEGEGQDDQTYAIAAE